MSRHNEGPAIAMMITLPTAAPAARPSSLLVLPLFLLTLLAAACSIGPGAPSGDDTPASPEPSGQPADSSTTAAPSPASPASQQATGETPIKITIANTVITARLADNATGRDLASQLPLRLSFTDLNQVEKIAQLPRPLSRQGLPAGADPDIGDIGYYAPSGDLVFYYGDVGYWNGIIRIGRFDAGMEPIEDHTDDFQATIERA
jgi:hypothetical protein